MCFVYLFLPLFINDIEFSRDLISSMAALLNLNRGIFSHAAQAAKNGMRYCFAFMPKIKTSQNEGFR